MARLNSAHSTVNPDTALTAPAQITRSSQSAQIENAVFSRITVAA